MKNSLINNVYHPFVLSNGTDFCQIDFNGSMGFKYLMNGYASYWYKKGRPYNWDPFGIVKPGYLFLSDKGIVQGDYKQSYDYQKGVLKTRISAYQLEMEIQSFLTEDHTYIEQYNILQYPSQQAEMYLDLSFPCKSYSNNPLHVMAMPPGEITPFIDDEICGFKYVYDDKEQYFAGEGKSFISVLNGDNIETTNEYIANDEPVFVSTFENLPGTLRFFFEEPGSWRRFLQDFIGSRFSGLY